LLRTFSRKNGPSTFSSNTSSYLIENNYNSSEIRLRNKNAIGGSVDYVFAYGGATFFNTLYFENDNVVAYRSGGSNQTNVGQSGTNFVCWNLTNSGSMIFRVENSSGTYIDAITTNYNNTTISNNLVCSTTSTITGQLTLQSNTNLPSTQTTQTSGQLGYIHQGTILNIASPVNNTTGTIYYLASMTLPVGVWNVFAQSCYTFSTGGTIANDTTSISTNASSYSIENIINFTNVIATTGINIYRRLNGIITSTGSTTLYLTFGLTGFSGGAVPQHSNSTQTYTRFYAVRIA
jgi:hypothetical protein